MVIAGFIPVAKVASVAVKGVKVAVKVTTKSADTVKKATSSTKAVTKSPTKPKSSGGDCNCFAAGTLVQTDNGDVPIEDIDARG
jgi:hypothetical protein